MAVEEDRTMGRNGGLGVEERWMVSGGREVGNISKKEKGIG